MAENSSVYWKALPLKPGRYRFDIVVKDVNGDRVGTWNKGVVVPDYADDKLSSIFVDRGRPDGAGSHARMSGPEIS